MSAAFLAVLRDHPVIAILRGTSADSLEASIDTLVGAGIAALEITLPTPGSLEAIRAATDKYSSAVWIGAGTVTTPEMVHDAKKAGAQFVVSPNTDPDVLASASAADLPALPGATTPSEILQAWNAGATAVKVFPVRSLGPSFISDVLAPLPQIPLIPVGGVDLHDVRRYLDAGAIALGVGSPLLGDALTGGPQEELHARAQAFVRASEA